MPNRSLAFAIDNRAIDVIQVKNCAFKVAKMQRGGGESRLWRIGNAEILTKHDKLTQLLDALLISFKIKIRIASSR
jgi:hypothetical protein